MSQALVTANFPLPSVVGSLDAYISAVHRIPVLSQEEEQSLSRDYLEESNLEAAKKRRHGYKPSAQSGELVTLQGLKPVP